MTADHTDPVRPAVVGRFVGVGNRILDADDEFLRILRLTRERFESMVAEGVLLSPEEWQRPDADAVRQLREHGSSAPYRKEFVRGDGTRVPTLVVAGRRLDADRWTAFAVDLSVATTPWPDTAEATAPPTLGSYDALLVSLTAERARVVSMLESTTVVFWSIDRECRLVGANDAFHRIQTRISGRRIGVGEQLLDLLSDPEAHRLWDAWYRRALDGDSFTIRRHLPAVNRTLEYTLSPIEDAVGRVIGAVIVGTDVTAQVAAERELARSEARFRATFTAIGDLAYIADEHWRLTFISDDVVEMLGVTPEDLIGTNIWRLAGAGPAEPPADEVIAALRVPGARMKVTSRYLHPKTGTPQWFETIFVNLIDEPAVRGYAATVHDITEQRSQAALLSNQMGLLDAASDAILIRDLDGRVTYWNRSAERLYGWTTEEAVGSHVSDLISGGDRSTFRAFNEKLLVSGGITGREVGIRRDGSSIIVDVHANLIRDAAGEPIAVFSVGSDVSEKVELEERLQVAQRLEAVGQLTGGLAHDLNNLLTVILGGADLLAVGVRHDPALVPVAGMVSAAATRGAEMIRRLLLFARRETLAPEIEDAGELVREVADLIRGSIPEHVEIQLDVPPDCWQVSVDPADFESALINLAINARDAMPDGGRLSIGVANVVVDERQGERFGGLPAGEYVRVQVVDTGTGIPDDIIGQVFEPFFSTKAVGEGSGLGLSMVYGFVKQSQGHVEIQSEPGVGTAVALYLPRTSGEPTPDEDADDGAAPPAPAAGTVLVVEDQPLVRDLAAQVLRDLGYQVLEAEDGPAAVEILTSEQVVDVVFTDVVMPGGMNGFELADRVEQLRPGTPIVITSGYAAEIEGDAGRKAEMLLKPYRPDELAARIGEAISRRARSDRDPPPS
jgi:PAS domain S-box-containing protein